MENTVKDIYSEVYAILNMLGKEYINKLPNDIYNIIKEEKSTEYNFVALYSKIKDGLVSDSLEAKEHSCPIP